ncbi:MAG: TRAP transporter substrate-binding protein DctP [Sulfurovum sp.]|nr:TRAP transporter substrate-binding protein DctP [Sulfurovum sp.]
MNKVTKAAVLVSAIALLASPLAAKKIKWKLAMTWPSTLTPLASPPARVAEYVKAMSDGEFVIKAEGKEKHKAPLGILDMVKGGQYQMGHSGSYYWKGKDINTVWFTSMPLGMTPSEQYSWFYYGNGMKYMKEVYDKFGIYNYPGGNTGNQMGGWFRKEIKTVEDLKGLKMRIPGLAGEVFAKLGVSVTNIPAGELYTSLDRGTIDALEWVGPGMDIKMGFHKVAPYYYTGWHEPASEMQFMVNKKAFDKLPKKYQTMLEVAMKAASFDMYVENFSASLEAWDKMKTDFPNIKVKTFPKPVIGAMKAAAAEVYEAYATKDPKFKEIYTDYKAYMKKARAWSQMMQGGYLNLDK